MKASLGKTLTIVAAAGIVAATSSCAADQGATDINWLNECQVGDVSHDGYAMAHLQLPYDQFDTLRGQVTDHIDGPGSRQIEVSYDELDTVAEVVDYTCTDTLEEMKASKDLDYGKTFFIERGQIALP